MSARVPVFGPCLVLQLVPTPASVSTTGVSLKTDTTVSTGSGASTNAATAGGNTLLAPSGGSHASKRTHALYRSLRSYCSRARTQRGKADESPTSRAGAASPDAASVPPVAASASACEASASTGASSVKAGVESVSVRSSPEDSTASGTTPPSVSRSSSDAVMPVSAGAASTVITNLVSAGSSGSLKSVIGCQSGVEERTNVVKSEIGSTTNENRGCNVDNQEYTNSFSLCTERDCDKYVNSEETTNKNKGTGGLLCSTAASSSEGPAIKSASDCSISDGAELNKAVDVTVPQGRSGGPGGDADTPHFAAVRKSPTRRSSFFHAINASLPPLDRGSSGGVGMSSPTSSTPSPSVPTSSTTVSNLSSVPTIPNCAPSIKTPHRTNFPSSTSPELTIKSRTSASTLTTNSPGTVSSPATTPVTLTGSSGTPTPTNAEAPSGPGAAGAGGAALNPDTLFKRWVAANAACCWVPELVGAVGAVQLLGAVVGGWLLVGGPPRALATLQHAHAHSLLQPPPGYTIGGVGEMSGCHVSPVPRAHFTPLGPALCWALHCHGGAGASLDSLRSALGALFPLMTLPDDATTHAALTDLIRQRLVYHVGRGYALVTPDTYGAQAAVGLPPKHPPFKLLSTSEALTRAHGAADAEPAGPVTHAAVQTDLADLLTQSLTMLTTHEQQQQKQGGLPGSQLRRGSLRVGRRGAPPSAPPDVATYEARDLTDVTVTAERGVGSSVLTKLLRVSSAPRLASFSAQFPPPEWSRPGAPPHGHCRSTQTRHGHTQPLPDNTLPPASAWAPRSSTLPRRPTRPLSSASLHCPSSSPTPPHGQEHNPHSSSNSTPSHHHPRQHHQSTSYSARVSSEGNVNASNGAATVYANPYRLLALHDQYRTQQQGGHHRHHHQDHYHHDHNQRQHIYASPREGVVATSNSLPNRYNPYSTALPASDSVNALDKSSLPPKPPTNELVHRRTLSASPRRIAGHAREEGTQRQHCSPQQQQQDRGKRQHYGSSSAVAVSSAEQTTVQKQCLLGGSTERQGLNNAYVAVRDDNDKGMLHLLHNSHPAPNVEHSLNDDCRRQGPSNDSSPKRKHHSGPQRPVFFKHLSPARQKIENTDNERILKERWRLGNLSSSLDSGILPDQRSSHRDSSEDRHRAGTFIAEVDVLCDPCWPSRSSDDKISANSKKDGCNRAALQLDLDKSHMNNVKKVFASPQKPEGMKNNRISSDLNNRIKGSTCDLTSKNLGYTDTNKCEKKLYVPNKTNNSLNGKQNISGKLTSIKHVISPTKKRAIKSKQDTIKNYDRRKSNEIGNGNNTLNLDTNKYTNDAKDARLLMSSPIKNDAIFLIAANNKDTSSVHYAGNSLKADAAHVTTDASSLLPCGSVDISVDGASSVRTYPSLSELNFSSLAAQKILRGVSVNSIDTLLEVNLAACDGKKLKVAEPITNTDFGYL